MFVTAISSTAMAAFKILGGLYIADFVSGVVHWAEDRYGDPKWPLLGHTIRENLQHHKTPRSFLKGTIWTRNREVLFIGIGFLGAFWALGWLNLMTISAVIFGICANEIHASAHRSPKENGPIITFLQRLGLMQSHMHHAAHHRHAKDSNYCVMTNHLNPILERMHLFRGLEWLVKKTTGLTPRPDPSVNPRYLAA